MATDLDVYQQTSSLDDLFGNDDEDMGDFGDLTESADATQLVDTMPTTPFEQSFNDPTTGNDELSALMNEGGENGFDLDELNSRELERGEKADDAVDYEDIGDDESLPDEEPTQDAPVDIPTDLLPGISDNALDGLGDDDDDLFGPSSPILTSAAPPLTPSQPTDKTTRDEDQESDLASEHGDDAPQDLSMLNTEMDDEEAAQWRIQMALFANSGKGTAPTTAQENIDEWLKLEFPTFKRDEAPFFNKLFPPRPFMWQGKSAVKPPKQIRPTKVALEIEQDQKVAFNSTVPVAAPDFPTEYVRTGKDAAVQIADESEDESDLDEPLPNGLTMRDLEFMCTDFDTLSNLAPEDEVVVEARPRIVDEDQDMFDFDEFNDFEQPHKKRKLGLDPRDIVTIHHIDVPSFDDPEKLTQRLAAKVVLDLNDTDLLVEEVDLEAARAKTRPGEKTTTVKTLKDKLQQRFKTSNDAEYDLLKQNHQHKVRGQLTNLTIEHSMPAIRLQYPYFQVRLSLQDLRNFHRKKMHFRHPVTFRQAARIKRKHQKNRSVKELYPTTKEISMADNSSTVLLEYSEEHPLMMSQPGMGNKIINYYRKKSKDDNFRPKHDIGEASLLLPEDKSPFHIFGHIDPGETMTALYNSMYRAPIFSQDPHSTDFLVIRESTGVHGQTHYLRNLENVYVVGQELPSVTVPGTHSRMVTTAAKNRLKAISYRIARKKKSQRIRVEDVTRHFPDTTDMQNRQKMKEFMVFNKEHKEWEMRAGDKIPTEDQIQSLIRPEDICLLESMQVGAQYLQDAGYADNDDEDDTKENEADSIEQQLAPWRTTKNFMQATQGKAMLKLFGEGDPSGRGEAFSFIKTSMKGGFRPIGGSAMDAITLKKELGGHSYNVARQQRHYEESIRGIWDKQKASLGSKIEPSDLDMDGDVDAQEDRHISGRTNVRATPVSGTQTPSISRRRDDETATSFSRRSVGSQTQKVLRIVRQVKTKDGEIVDQEYIETDPAVIKKYMKIKEAEEFENTEFVYIFDLHGHFLTLCSIQDIVPTGDPEQDARAKKRQAPVPFYTRSLLTFSVVSRISSPNSKRTKPAERNVPKTRKQLPASPLVALQCLPTATPLSLVAKTPSRHNASVQIVVKWATSRPTKSQ
jgi:transcription initiation factor TFIID subunit 1, fungi type